MKIITKLALPLLAGLALVAGCGSSGPKPDPPWSHAVQHVSNYLLSSSGTLAQDQATIRTLTTTSFPTSVLTRDADELAASIQAADAESGGACWQCGSFSAIAGPGEDVLKWGGRLDGGTAHWLKAHGYR